MANVGKGSSSSFIINVRVHCGAHYCGLNRANVWLNIRNQRACCSRHLLALQCAHFVRGRAPGIRVKQPGLGPLICSLDLSPSL